jgi:hypothetical protein
MKTLQNKIRESEIRPNGYYFNILFALYYFFIAPYINEYVFQGQRNILVAIFGLIIYVAELYSFNFKTKLIRLRANEKRLRIIKESGKDYIIPQPGCVVSYGVVSRMLFRFGFIMLAMTSLGFDPGQEKQSPFFTAVLVAALLFECGVLAYTYAESGVFGSTAQDDKWDKEKEEAKKKEWLGMNLPKLNSEEYKKKELFSDVVLHLYAFMLFTAFWTPINEGNKQFVHDAFVGGDPAFTTGCLLFFIYLVMALLAFPPIRLAYWIEESVQALTSKEKWKLWGSFILAASSVALPGAQEFIRVYFLK